MKQNGGNWLMAKSRVQEYITGAMFELLEKKDYAHITVQDLVDRAGVCRASFYRNYFTMDEVIDRFLDGVFTESYPGRPCPRPMWRSASGIFSKRP